MKRSLFTKGLTALAAIGIVLAALVVSPPVAHAAPPAGLTMYTAAGSDTIEEFMNKYLANPGADTATDNGHYNVHARYPTGFLKVPADTTGSPACGTINWNTGDPATPLPKLTAPDGSGAGLDALVGNLNDADSTNDGCVDIARSSSAPRANCSTTPPLPVSGCDRPTTEYYAFGLDSVAVASASLNAPALLTVDQVRKIYDCTFTNWSQVGGSPGPIQRYLPQINSGTRRFFVSEWLGLGSGTSVFPSNGSCPAVIQTADIQENTGLSIKPEDFQTAIIPYSSGQWLSQANNSINPTLDLRHELRLLAQPATKLFDATIADGSATITAPTNFTFTGVNQGAAIGSVDFNPLPAPYGTESPNPSLGIPANTTIVPGSITANGTQATLSNAATEGGSVKVRMTSLSATTVRWINTAPGGWLPNNALGAASTAPVREGVVQKNNAVRDFFGIRYVWNAIDSLAPNYTGSRDLIGFNNSGGTKSAVCNSSQLGNILDAGFQFLPTTNPAEVNPATNTTASSCRRFDN